MKFSVKLATRLAGERAGSISGAAISSRTAYLEKQLLAVRDDKDPNQAFGRDVTSAQLIQAAARQANGTFLVRLRNSNANRLDISTMRLGALFELYQ